MKYELIGERVSVTDRDPSKHYYDLRSRPEGQITIEKFVLVDHVGTLITDAPIKEVEEREFMMWEDFVNEKD